MSAATSPDAARMRDAADDVVRMLKAVGNQDRLMLLCELARGERCVGQLEENLAIRQPTLSQQLGVLRTEGLVAGRRDGKHVYYRVADPQALQLLRSLEQVFCARPTPATSPTISRKKGTHR